LFLEIDFQRLDVIVTVFHAFQNAREIEVGSVKG
jgi:hypothetical protein